VAAGEVGEPMPLIELQCARGDKSDIALIDAVAVRGAFIGSLAVWNPGALLAAVVSRPDPTSMGIAGVAGLASGGVGGRPVRVEFSNDGTGRSLTAPLVPGRFDTVEVAAVASLDQGERTRWTGPLVIALDGERSWSVAPGEAVDVVVSGGGPVRIDVARAVSLGAERGVFWSDAG